jgi:succinoglycan biosynthesis protein ExoA
VDAFPGDEPAWPTVTDGYAPDARNMQGVWRRRVLIVVPTLNEAAHIEAILTHLIDEISPSADARIVVVDGGSTDGTPDQVAIFAERHSAIRFLHNPARIQSAGVNLAVRQFGRDAEVLIRCDAHAGYPDRFCEQLLAALEHSGADAVVVPLDSVGHTALQRAVAWVSNSIVGTGGAAHRAGRRSAFVDHGHHAAFQVETFRRIGGYDETFSHNEDAEFDCRQRALGAKVYLDAGIRLQYCPRGTWTGLALQYYCYGAGRARTLRRHPTSIRLRQLLVPANLVLMILALALSPYFVGFLLWPALYLTVLATTSLSMALRHRATDGLLTGPAAAVMHTAWAVGLLSGIFGGRDSVWRAQMAIPLWDSESRVHR